MGCTVLIITNKYDVHADHLVPLIESRSAHVIRLNTEDFLTHYRFAWKPDNSGSLSRGRHLVNFASVDAVWYRKPSLCDLPDEWATYRDFLAEELRATLGGIYASLRYARWVNPLDNQRRAAYKLLQLNAAASLGLEIPDTIVTNAPNEAAQFAAKHAENGLAIKAIGSGLVHLPKGQTIFTNRLRYADGRDWTRINQFPVFLQEYIPKASEIRVTIVGDSVFACASILRRVQTRRRG